MRSHSASARNNQHDLIGSQSAVGRFAFYANPRDTWRGFSFGYYYFSFSNSSPFCAREQMNAG